MFQPVPKLPRSQLQHTIRVLSQRQSCSHCGQQDSICPTQGLNTMLLKGNEQLNKKGTTLTSGQEGEVTTKFEVQSGSDLKASCNGKQESAKCF